MIPGERFISIMVCPECGVQQMGISESHSMPCPNAGRLWVPEYVEVVPRAVTPEQVENAATAIRDAAWARRGNSEVSARSYPDTAHNRRLWRQDARAAFRAVGLTVPEEDARA